MPLPKKETRGGLWWLGTFVLAIVVLAVFVGFVSTLLHGGDSDEPHRPPHVTSSSK